MPHGLEHVGLMARLVNPPILVQPFPFPLHDGDHILIISQIPYDRQGELLETVDAGNRPRLFTRRIQRRQKHSGKDCNNCNYHEELYKG